jgi:hypothetical protein
MSDKLKNYLNENKNSNSIFDTKSLKYKFIQKFFKKTPNDAQNLDQMNNNNDTDSWFKEADNDCPNLYIYCPKLVSY